MSRREATMRTLKRFGIALGTLAAVLLAGGATTASRQHRGREPHKQSGGEDMKLITRIAVAIGSLMALVLAGGAHWKG
jgi:hypothetical protein